MAARNGTWKVVPTGKDSAEVIAGRTRYTIACEKTSFTIHALQGDRVIEKHYFYHRGHNYVLEGTDRRGVTERLRLNVTRKRVVTRGQIGRRKFVLESKPFVHGPKLVEELRAQKHISLTLIHDFAERLSNDARFRKQIYQSTRLSRPLRQPDWVDQACAVACTICFFLAEPVSCVICSLCTDPDPVILTA